MVLAHIAMNIYTMPMPVKTPTNDDLIYGSNFKDEWKTFCKRFPFSLLMNAKIQNQMVWEAEYVIPPSLIDAVTKKAIDVSDEAKLTDVYRNIDIAVQAYTIQKEAELKKYTNAKDADEKRSASFTL